MPLPARFASPSASSNAREEGADVHGGAAEVVLVEEPVRESKAFAFVGEHSDVLRMPEVLAGIGVLDAGGEAKPLQRRVVLSGRLAVFGAVTRRRCRRVGQRARPPGRLRVGAPMKAQLLSMQDATAMIGAGAADCGSASIEIGRAHV